MTSTSRATESSHRETPIGGTKITSEEWDEDDGDYLPCPACGADVYEDAPQCPACGEYITHSTHPFQGRPMWWVALGVIGIMAVIAALLGLSG